MPSTRQDLIVRVLDLLGVTQVGQDPSAEDAAKVDGFIDGKLEEIARRKILHVVDSNAIDDEYLLPIAKLVANAAGPAFGTPYDADADAREEMRLRDINRRQPVYKTLRTQFY